MHVLILGEYFPPDIGGAATRASNVAKGLTANGCNVTVVTAFPHYPSGKTPKEYRKKIMSFELVGRIKVIRTPVVPLKSTGLFNRLLIFFSFMVSSLFALPSTGTFDVVWAANPDVFILAPAVVYGKLKRKPVVSNVDDLIIEDLYDLGLVKQGSFISAIAEFSAKFLFSRVKAATPISPGYVKTIQRYGVSREKITVIRVSVDTKLFKSSKKTEDKHFVVLYSGGFSIAYDFDQILKAAKEIEKLDSSIEFIVQGKGELYDSILAKVRELRLINVKIIDRLLSREAVVGFLNQADALILPLASFKTPYRGLSSKLYEYQAVGKPIICCSDGTPKDYVLETNSGIVVQPGDHLGIVNAVLTLKNNPCLCLQYGDNGRRYVEQEATVEQVGLKLKSVLLHSNP